MTKRELPLEERMSAHLGEEQETNEVMANAPVFYALAQAQFNPIAAMAKYVSDVQDILRHQGYTEFEPQTLTQLQFSPAPGQAPTSPEATQVTRWLITKPDRTAGFILGQSALSYHTTHYEGRHQFLPQLLLGLEAVHRVVKLDYLTRLGLRYLNSVLPQEGETVDQYLIGEVRGVDMGAPLRYSLSESVFDTQAGPLMQKGVLIARVRRAPEQLAYPPDLAPSGLVTMPEFGSRQEEAVPRALIDLEHYVEGRMRLNLANVRAQLPTLHAGIEQAFEAVSTKHARAVWA
jgi:uncharacterized protein (TIGR04255 family)